MNSITISKEDIIDVENILFSAQVASDVIILDQLLHDELIAVSPTGEIVTKEQDLSSHKAKTMNIEEASTVIDEIRIAGDTALTVVTMAAKGKVMGTQIEGRFRYFRTWKRFGDKLQVIGASFMQLPG